MAFTVEYTFTRPNTDVDWTYEFGPDQEAHIQALREMHSITTQESTSSDGLVYTLRQTAEDSATYNVFYNAGQPIWEAAGIVYNSSQAGIELAMDIIENT